ncbi:MAG: SpvB/TcaC N-terminal domain-containing protein, partial [Bacteroidota bacterium]
MRSPDNPQRLTADSRQAPRADSQAQSTPAAQAQPTQGGGQGGSSGRPEPRIQVSELSLPKGGGAIQGIGETFQANEFSGTASMSIPIAASPCRDFAPSLSVDYSSGGGNGVFGMGFAASIPQVSRQTRLGTPKYTNKDVFVLSGAADLVPVDGGSRVATLQGVTYAVQAYRPRQEGLFALIEYWQPEGQPAGGAFWKVTTKDHIVSIYGKTEQAKIVDPDNANHVFTWLLEESYNAKGDHQLFSYKQENADNVPATIYEKNHVQTAHRYIERIRYGNQTSIADSMLLTSNPAVTDPAQWHFEVVFDYGEYDLTASNPYTPVRAWAARPDPFSSYHAGFEIRTHRRCLHTLMFHRFAELGTNPVLTQATAYDYTLNYAQMSELTSVTETGYSYNTTTHTYTTASLPSLALKYVPFAPEGHTFAPLTDEQGDALKGLDNPPNHTLVDLFGEGIPGILYTNGVSTYYREAQVPLSESVPAGDGAPPAIATVADSSTSPLAYGGWQTLTSFPLPRHVEGGNIALQDITGDGQLDIVANDPEMDGYWEAQVDKSWQDFRAFETWPVDFPEPAQTWVDVTGDGVVDLVQLTTQGVHVYPSAQAKGLGDPYVSLKVPSMPETLDGSPTEAVRFADMAGSGQSHLVRVRNGEVVYWPNLSYGHFGKPITMGNAPTFGTDFSTERLFMADLDGSGTADMIYMDTHQATIYFSESGNKFSDAVVIPLPIPLSFDDLDRVTFSDVYGRGNECLVLSAPHAAPNPRHWCYDFCQGKKPYLLHEMGNNMGAKTTITYKSSVDFYLAGKKKGIPWITTLPFPVQVIAQVTHSDAIAGSSYTSLYSYHHGFYDGVEREFRGFGRVDRQDTEYFSPSKIDPGKDPQYVAPSLSRTWYHTGAFLKAESLSRQYAKEYFQGDAEAFPFPDSVIDWGGHAPDGETQRQAAVALAGTVLRSELYGLDSGPQASVPYTVSESNLRVLLQQAMGTNPYAIFFTHPEQSLTYNYERNATDPQVSQSCVLKVDAYGNVERSCAIAYPRRAVSGALAEQQQLYVTCETHSYVNHTTPQDYLLG